MSYGLYQALNSHRYYDTCTRDTETPGDLHNEYWCPTFESIGADNLTVEDFDAKGHCNEVIYPEQNGCNDHYESVSIGELFFCL